MAYQIINNIIPGLPKFPYRYGIGAYEGVVAHATAVYAPDENQVAYFLREWNKRKSFVQFFVDWDSIRQTSELDYKAWGAGPVANQRYVHVELCETKDPAKFKESYKRYVWLLARILHQKRLGVVDGKTLVSHDWVSRNLGGTNHTDPIGYLKSHGVSWYQLVSDVKKEYENLDKPKEMTFMEKFEDVLEKELTNLREKPVSAWAEKQWKEATENGYFDGTAPQGFITRQETAAVINRIRHNFKGLFAEMDERIKKIGG